MTDFSFDPTKDFVFRIHHCQDDKYRFSLLLYGVLCITDRKSYDSIIDTLEGLKSFKFLLDESFTVINPKDFNQFLKDGTC